jgi:transposase
MELLSVIRRWALRDQLSIREISRRTGLSRNTIRKYLRADVAVFEREAHRNSRDGASRGQVRAGALAKREQFVVSSWVPACAADSGHRDQAIRSIVITDSGDPDHAACPA